MKSLFAGLARFTFPVFLLLLPFVFFGCAIAPVPPLKMPASMPDTIREYKTVKILGGQMGWLDTGIQVKEGEYITMTVDGQIWRNAMAGGVNYGAIASARYLIYKIGDREEWGYFRDHEVGFLVSKEGAINLNYYVSRPGDPWSSFRLRDSGAFSIHITVWKKYDPVSIANFFQEASQNNPSSRDLRDYAKNAKQLKEIFLAEQKAKQEVEGVTQSLAALKGKDIPGLKETLEKKETGEFSGPKIQEAAKEALTILQEEDPGKRPGRAEKQVAELSEKLEKALQSLKELDELKKKFQENEAKEKEFLALLEESETRKQQGITKIPPVIVVASPKDGMVVENETISLDGVAESEKGIIAFEILVNEQQAVRKDTRGLRVVGRPITRADFSEKIRLREGKNEISILAEDSEGLKGKRTLSLQLAKKKMEIWAAVIGIGKYKSVPSLKYAANDAREFHRYLVERLQVPKDHIWLLLDEEATLDNLRRTLGTQLRRRAGKDDMVIIYLASHGSTERDADSLDGDGLEKYILPHNADPKDLYASALPMNEVSQIFRRISSERIVLIADTCYSGATGGRTIRVAGERASVSGSFLDRLSRGKGRLILTASEANEVSIEKDELKHGVFTYYLLEGLKGEADYDGDGVITLDEIYRYVSTKVPQATGQDQHPVKKGEMTGQIILGVLK